MLLCWLYDNVCPFWVRHIVSVLSVRHKCLFTPLLHLIVLLKTACLFIIKLRLTYSYDSLIGICLNELFPFMIYIISLKKTKKPNVTLPIFNMIITHNFARLLFTIWRFSCLYVVSLDYFWNSCCPFSLKLCTHNANILMGVTRFLWRKSGTCLCSSSTPNIWSPNVFFVCVFFYIYFFFYLY